MTSTEVVLILLPAGNDVLNDWLEFHGYRSASRRLQRAGSGVLFVEVRFGDQALSDFLTAAGHPTAAHNVVSRDYKGVRG
jgi:hypothetical protein